VSADGQAQTAAGAPARRTQRFVLGSLHGLVVVAAVLGVLVQVVRPLAPDLGPPPDPARWFDEAFLEVARGYRQPRYVLSLLVLVLRLSVPLLVALTPPGRRLVDRVVERVGPHRPARAATVLVLAVMVVTELLVLPIAFWAGFVQDGRYGLRTQGLAGWAYDWAVANGLALAAAAVVVLLGYTLVRRLPRAWPPVVVLAGVLATAGVVFLGPLVVEPLTFRTEPLPAGPVRDEVDAVVARSGIDFERILVADASRRSTRRNAYVSGLWGSRRIVLYDTLVDNHPPAEVGAVLAHELGHHRHGDLTRGTLSSATGLAIGVYLLAFVVRRRTARGKQDHVADPRAAVLVLGLVLVLNAISLPVQNLASRRAEAAADLAALDLTRDPDTFVAKNLGLSRANLSNPRPPAWTHALWSTHPMVVSRLEMAERWPGLERDR
jgi:STE24 endopeptidase